MRARPLLLLASVALAGCGGGDSTVPQIIVNPAPTPSPSPPPSPSPTPSPTASAPIGLEQPGDFATLGWAFRYTTDRDGSNPRGSTEPDAAAPIEIGYVATANAYEMRLPDVSRGRLAFAFPATNFTSLRLPWPGAPDIAVLLYRPGAGNTELALSFTSLGSWSATRPDPADPTRFDLNFGDFTYGVPTPPAAVPASGTRQYGGIAYGGGIGFITGTADLTIDFATGTVTGALAPMINDGVGSIAGSGRYELDAARISADGRLSGQFRGSAGVQGTFEGRLTGPAAEEMMVRWRGEFFDPHNNRTRPLAGIWVARRRP